MVLPRLTLFTRPGCTLCDPVKFIIRKAQQKVPSQRSAVPHPAVQFRTSPHLSPSHSSSFSQRSFTYSEVDISQPQHSAWLAAYTNDIPVVHLNDREVARHRLSESDLIAALDSASHPP